MRPIRKFVTTYFVQIEELSFTFTQVKNIKTLLNTGELGYSF